MSKKRIWQIHSWMGLIAGLGLLVIGLTGSLLVFAKELEQVFNPEFISVKEVRAERLPMDALIQAANRALPDYEVTGWLVRHDEPHLADVIYGIQHGTDEWRVGTIDPYTGELRATPRENTATLTGWLLELHYAFFADHGGMLVTGVFAVVLCLLGISGLWLYRDFWRSFFRLRWRASARILFSDIHKMVGIPSVAFNLLLGFTGAYWNFTHVVGEWIEGEHVQPVVTKRYYNEQLSLDQIVAEGAQRVTGFRANFISLPSEADGPITLWGSVEPSNLLRGKYGSTVVFDSQTGEFKTSSDIRNASAWGRFVDMFEPLHFGDFGGLPIKVIWCAAGLAPGLLAVSGFLIWFKRTRAKKRTAGVTSSSSKVEEVALAEAE